MKAKKKPEPMSWLAALLLMLLAAVFGLTIGQFITGQFWF